MRTLKGEVGNWVDGDRFWGRKHELARLTELLAEGANVSIVAQRRIGKTSLMRETAKRLEGSCLCLHLDLQDATTSAGFVHKLGMAVSEHKPLWKKACVLFKNTLSKITSKIESISYADLNIALREDLSGPTWQAKGERLFAILADHDQRVVLFVDELPILVSRLIRSEGTADERSGKADADTLLSWLRARCLEHNGRIGMALAGSIGLEPMLGVAGLSATLNHCTPFPLEPWDTPTARECLKALAAYRRLELTDNEADRMLELLGCPIPYHVQLFFSCLRDHCTHEGRSSCSPEEIETIYRHQMVGTRGHAEMSHLEERLRREMSDEQYALAMSLLTRIAVQGSLTPGQARDTAERLGLPPQQAASLLSDVVHLLLHDGYLRRTADGYTFVSHLLRDWWKGRFGDFYGD
jgi:hypothetical protein